MLYILLEFYILFSFLSTSSCEAVIQAVNDVSTLIFFVYRFYKSVMGNINIEHEAFLFTLVLQDSVLVNCIKTSSPAMNKIFEFERFEDIVQHLCFKTGALDVGWCYNMYHDLIPRVHGPDDDQETVFEEVKPLLTSLLDGWVFCSINPHRSRCSCFTDIIFTYTSICLAKPP